MHRKKRVPPVLLRGLLVLGLLAWEGGSLGAQPEADKTMRITGTVSVPINGTLPLRMSKKQLVGRAESDKPDVVAIGQALADQSGVILRGVAPGIARVTLTSLDGKETEVYEVLVQTDVELLRSVLARAVPTANVIPIPGGGNTIILTGWVARSEDVQTIMDVARTFTGAGVGAASIVNALKVGGVMQVQLDVVVARVARSELRRMGFDWHSDGQRHFLTSAPSGLFQDPSIGSITGGGDQPLQIPNQIITAPSAFLGIFTADQLFFFFLQALRDNNLAKVLAEPRLVTLSGKPADFVAGGEQAVPVVSGLGGTAGVQFVPFGTLLSFLPIVLGNGKIYLEVETGVTNLDAANGTSLPGGGFVAGRVVQRVRNAVEIEPGQTLVVGGLIQNTVQGSFTKVPVLGDLPFIGVAFGRKNYNEVEEEVVLLVTPHLVDPMDCSQLPKYLPGQETRRPDDYELFLEGIMEAPRGQRKVCPDRRYVPAYKHSPTLSKFPCGGDSCASGHGCPNGEVSCPTEKAAPAGTAVGSSTYPVTSSPGTMMQEPAALPLPVSAGSGPLVVPVGGSAGETAPGGSTPAAPR